MLYSCLEVSFGHVWEVSMEGEVRRQLLVGRFGMKFVGQLRLANFDSLVLMPPDAKWKAARVPSTARTSTSSSRSADG